MGIFDVFKMKKGENKKGFNQPNAALDHLTDEGELPWGWVTRNKDFTEQIGSDFTYFLNMWLDSKKKSPEERFQALKSFILYLEDVEQLCKSKGECFEFWYYEILTSHDYIEKRKAELIELQTSFEEIQEVYMRKQNNMIGIEEKVIELLKKNDGIAQSEFIKLFDSSVKGELSKILYYWEKAGMIERIKEGRSYVLHFKGNADL